MEKISWTDHVRNEEVLLTAKEKRNILHEIRKRKANWIGHILRRNCLLQRVFEWKIKGGIEVTGRRGRKRRKLLEDLKERRGYSHLKEEALDRTMWRARFGRGFGPVVRQTTKWMRKVMENKNTDQSLALLIQEFSGFKGLGVGISKIMYIVPEKTVLDHRWRRYVYYSACEKQKCNRGHSEVIWNRQTCGRYCIHNYFI